MYRFGPRFGSKSHQRVPIDSSLSKWSVNTEPATLSKEKIKITEPVALDKITELAALSKEKDKDHQASSSKRGSLS